MQLKANNHAYAFVHKKLCYCRGTARCACQ